MRRRHKFVLISLVVVVFLPVLAAALYLYCVARDQYASTVGFVVRREAPSSSAELLGGLSALGGAASSDAQALYEYLKNPDIVRAVASRVDLNTVFTNAGDPFYSLGPDRRIEALDGFWRRMVSLSFDTQTGLTEVQVRAFRPEDAQAVSQAIYDESLRLVNALSEAARVDATRYARAELDQAVSRLRAARRALTEFRIEKRMVAPDADIQGRMGMINALQDQLVAATIELDLLHDYTSSGDPRIVRAEQKVAVIRRQLMREREGFSGDDATGRAFPELVGSYETLNVDLDYAEKAYGSAQAAYDMAQAEARRRSLYLATYLAPTLAETAEYPRRFALLGALAGLLFIGWAIVVLSVYSLRDRR